MISFFFAIGTGMLNFFFFFLSSLALAVSLEPQGWQNWQSP